MRAADEAGNTSGSDVGVDWFNSVVSAGAIADAPDLKTSDLHFVDDSGNNIPTTGMINTPPKLKSDYVLSDTETSSAHLFTDGVLSTAALERNADGTWPVGTNGWYMVRVDREDGTWARELAHISNLDITMPQLSVQGGSGSIEITASDNGSLASLTVNDYPIAVSGNVYTGSFDAPFTGTYKVVLKDNAGNKAEKTVQLTVPITVDAECFSQTFSCANNVLQGTVTADPAKIAGGAYDASISRPKDNVYKASYSVALVEAGKDPAQTDFAAIGEDPVTFESLPVGEYEFYVSDSAGTTQKYTNKIKIAHPANEWEAPTYEWNADNSRVTAKHVCHLDATHFETETVNTTSEITQGATCTEAGVRRYTAEFSNKDFRKQTKEVPIAPINHEYGEWTFVDVDTHQRVCANDPTHIETDGHTWNKGKVTTPATCRSEGVKTYTCTVCGGQKTEPIAKDPENHEGGTEIRDAIKETCGKDGYTGDTYCKGCDVKLSEGSKINKTGKHTWNDGVVTKAATCKDTGIMTYTCRICDATRTEVIDKDAANHTGETEIRGAKEATCGEDGYTGDTYCKDCGEKLSDGSRIDKTGKHTWDDGVVTTAATCKNTGIMTYTCLDCGETKTEIIDKDAENHAGGTEVRGAKEPGCGEDGYTGDTYCKGCGAKLSGGEAIEKTGAHSWDAGTITKPATCRAEGIMTYTCTVCGEQKTESIAKDPANHVGRTEVRNAKDPTCGEDGYTGDTYCKACGAKLTDGEAIEKTGEHSWDAGTVTKPATCKAEGIMTYTCTVCGEQKTESIAKDPANHVGRTEVRNAKDPTCGEDGYTGDTYCKACGVKLSGGEAIEKTGEHTWDDGTVTKPATCSAEGVMTYTCSVCGEQKTESIAKDPANHVGKTEVRNAREATCGEDGYTGDTYCKGCGAKLSGGEAIEKTGEHTWDDGTVTKPATCGAEGVMTYTCAVCGEKKTESIAKDPANHFGETEIRNAKDATCGEDGYTGDIYCKGCGAKLSGGEAIEKTGEHTWDDGTLTKAATCSSEGVKTYTCTVCGEQKTESVAKDPANHVAETEVKNAKEATCGEDGYTGDIYCKGCGAKLSGGEAIEKTVVHSWDVGTLTKPATCKAEGIMTYTCTVCGEQKTESIAKDPANHVGQTEVRNAKEATCGEDGYTGDTYCMACGAKLTDGEKIEKTGTHVWDEGKITAEAQIGADGEKTFTCTLCGQTKVEPIPSLPDEEQTTQPPVTEPGVFYLPGDVNLDGKINSSDARRALRAAGKLDKLSELETLLADIDGNKKISSSDARKILRIAARLDPAPGKMIEVNIQTSK